MENLGQNSGVWPAAKADAPAKPSAASARSSKLKAWVPTPLQEMDTEDVDPVFPARSPGCGVTSVPSYWDNFPCCPSTERLPEDRVPSLRVAGSERPSVTSVEELDRIIGPGSNGHRCHLPIFPALTCPVKASPAHEEAIASVGK